MKVSFYLLDKKRDKTSLMFNISYGGKQIKASTKIVLPTNNWNQKRQHIVKHQFRLELNQELNHYRTEIEKFCLENKPSIQELKDFIVIIRDGINLKEEQSEDIIKNFRNYINEKSKLLMDSYISKIRQLEGILIKFEKFYKTKLTFSDMDEHFRNDFIEFQTDLLNLKNNTAFKNLQILKTFLHWTTKKGCNKYTQFIYDFKIKIQNIEIVALNEDELSKIENTTFKHNYLEKTKSLFLMQIYTGLRYSDLINLKKENFDFINKRIIVTQIKTKESVIIPISPKLDTYLKKYDYTIPKISNQKYNDYIKQVCKDAGIDTSIQTVYYQGNKRIEEIKPKYELISSHTARRTFITISLKRGVLPETVMKVSGHRDRKSFQKYVRIAQEEAVEEIRNVWG